MFNPGQIKPVNHESKSVNTAVIAGAVVGSLCGLALIFILLWLGMKRQRRLRQEKTAVRTRALSLSLKQDSPTKLEV